jgi:phosphotriesterase-related protein
MIETVTGPIEPDALGVTLVHEHLRFRDEATAAQWSDRYDEARELERAVAAVRAAAARGVETIVDPTAMYGGRDVRFMEHVSRATDVHVVACTGIYTFDHLPEYFDTRDVDEMAGHFVGDIEDGIQGTAIKAGFLKCAADAAGVTPNVEKVHRAVARASVRTGVPIMAHTRPASATCLEQIAIFRDEGVDVGRVHLAHLGDRTTAPRSTRSPPAALRTSRRRVRSAAGA